MKPICALLLILVFIALFGSLTRGSTQVLIGLRRGPLLAEAARLAVAEELAAVAGRIEYEYRFINAVLAEVPEEALPPLDENEFYYYEIVGYQVQTTSGRVIGAIHDTLATGSNDVWIVKDGDREYLIPVISEVVRSVDRVSRTVLIEPMEGLLDL